MDTSTLEPNSHFSCRTESRTLAACQVLRNRPVQLVDATPPDINIFLKRVIATVLAQESDLSQFTQSDLDDGTIVYLRRSFANGNGIDDLALRVSVNAGVPRVADPPLRSQMLNQLLFQRSPRLYE